MPVANLDHSDLDSYVYIFINNRISYSYAMYTYFYLYIFYDLTTHKGPGYAVNAVNGQQAQQLIAQADQALAEMVTCAGVTADMISLMHEACMH